ncbi:hypothetical protein POF51_25950 [Brevibacillus sp. AG]|uniref:type IV secretion system protein n=1 Tax=Brevibacillus sp. AG TaxID=3020891 RepID=UPI00232A9545|nr:hypothetical protein [Brevibacillus sp. AG]MDC0764167.1 hypothetical protein [Brevibacillus sp. AG]
MDFNIGDLLVEAIIGLVQPILDFISNHTDSIMELVFNFDVQKDVRTGEVISTGPTNLLYGLFSSSELETLIKPGVDGMMKICALLLLVGVIFFGIRLARQGTNERLRSENMSMLFTMAFAMFLLGNVWVLYDMMFLFNDIIVHTFRGMAFQKLGGANFTSGVDENTSAILSLVLNLIMIGLSLWANFYYIMRKLMIILLMITGPIFITLSIYPHLRQVTSTWGKELFSNIISQAIHAIMLWIFIVMSNSQQSWLLQIVFLATFIPLSEAIKSLLGASGDTGKMATGSSISALAGAAALTGSIASAAGSNNVSSLMNKLPLGGGSNSRGVSAPGAGGYSPAASSFPNSTPALGTINPFSNHTLTNSRTMNRGLKAGRVMSRLGATTGAVLGATAMAPLGPMAMAMGASAGANVLSAAGAVSGRAGWQTAETVAKGVGGGVTSVYRGFKPNGAISQAGQGSKPIGKRAAQIQAMTSELGKGVMSGIGIKGGTENVLRNAISHGAGIVTGERGYNFSYGVADRTLGALKPSSSELKSKVDDKELRNLRVIQTNEGTYLTAKKRGNDGKYTFHRISRVAEANPVLRNGEAVEMDARFVKGGRLHIDESSMRFREADKTIRTVPSGDGKKGTIDRDYARTKYTKVEPTDFFSAKNPEQRDTRAKRDLHSKWIQNNAFGGKN